MFDEIGKQNSSNLAKFLDYENPQELDFHNFGFVTVDQHKLHNKYRRHFRKQQQSGQQIEH